MILIVTYNLKGPSTQYTNLYEFLQRHDSWWHYLPSTWLLATNKTPKEIFDAMKPLILEGDHVLIVKFTSDYYGWLPAKAWEWITTHSSLEAKEGTTK